MSEKGLYKIDTFKTLIRLKKKKKKRKRKIQPPMGNCIRTPGVLLDGAL